MQSDFTPSVEDIALFWSRVNKDGPNGCWLWIGGHSNGYGQHTIRGWESRKAHRIAYTLLIGPIPKGLQIHHHCRNRGCVNPAHLEPVTWRRHIDLDNMPAARNAAKTHCKRGHPLIGDNLRLEQNKGHTGRVCRACAREKSRKWRAANKEKVAAGMRRYRAANPERWRMYRRQLWKEKKARQAL